MTTKAFYSVELAERYIRDSLEQWALATSTNDPSVVERIMGEDLAWHLEDGQIMGKEYAVEEAATGPHGCISLVIDELSTSFDGDVAISEGKETYEMENGERGQLAFYYTWHRRNKQWFLVDCKDKPIS